MDSVPSTSSAPAASESLHAHNAPRNRYLITGQLKLAQALHIGSGRGDDTTDALVVVNGHGQPIVPGSSLRGALRAHTERLIAALHAAGSPYWACGLYESETPGGRVCVGNLSHPVSKSAYDQLLKREEQNPGAIWDLLESHLCDACRLFGAGSVWASPLRISDLSLRSGGSRQIRHGVGIHRDTGTAAPGIKYDREVVDAGSIFDLEIVADNLGSSGLAILALALGQLRDGEIDLGGGTGRGLGGCHLIEGKVYWVDMSNRNHLIHFLTAGAGALPDQRYLGFQSLDDFVTIHLGRLLPSEEVGGEHAQATV